ncbi:MAG TPA: SDR family oxidoreductase [Polyangiaceae bacterium]|nr:SDR family oxidoreductase [Polyangiaceae bacterium]
MKPFEDAWVLVSGASSGLGEEFARQLAHAGANLILTARSAERLERLALDLQRVAGVRAHPLAADLAEPDGPSRLCAAVDALGVPVDHLINNAGFGATGPFSATEPGAARDMVRVNVEAVTTLTRHFLPKMLAAGRGGIINVASTAAHQPVPFMATYAASKAFVLSFSLALAAELKGSGVRVMALCPGPVPTGFQERAGIDRARMFRLAMLSSADTVELALAAYDKGKELFVPGRINRAQTLAAKLLPRPLLTWGALRASERMGRDR